MKRFLLSSLLLFLSIGCSNSDDFDLIIRNGSVVDGSGVEAFKADLAIREGKIVQIGDLGPENTAREEIDASGRIIAPGFIDIHTHAERNLLDYPHITNYVSQGVTTVIGGNCGSSPVDIGQYLAQAESTGMAVNLGLLVGHNSVRRKVMGSENREPTPEEMQRMRELVGKAMEAGAMGMSTGLKYIPGAYAKTDEVVELAQIAGQYGGIYVTHMREEGLGLFDALRETLSIGVLANIPVQVSHFKAMGKSMWGSPARMISMIDSARARGLDVTFDQYPYTATSTGLGVLLPAWAFAGGRDQYLQNWQNPDTRAKIRDAIVHNLLHDRGGGDPASIVIIRSEHDSTLDGKNLAEITQLFFGSVDVGKAAETVIQLMEKGRHSCIYHCLNEEDVRRLMTHPLGMVASDGHTVSAEERFPHPRNFGTFPRVLGQYVRELGVLALPTAINKMTGAVAERLNIPDRGEIAPGNWADLVIFDPLSITDHATWSQPKNLSSGIDFVLVNGEMVLSGGEQTGKLPGMTLRSKLE